MNETIEKCNVNFYKYIRHIQESTRNTRESEALEDKTNRMKLHLKMEQTNLKYGEMDDDDDIICMCVSSLTY